MRISAPETHEEALVLIEEQGKLALAEVLTLPDRVYKTAKTLGLVRKDPVHFILTSNDGRHPTDSTMTVTKIVPPIITKNGDSVSHSIMIYRSPFHYDMNRPENEFAAAKDKMDFLDPHKIQHYKGGFIDMRRAHCVTSLCHELVHIFVTDEYMERFKGWTLERLELLTDSITVEAVYPIIERSSQDDFVKTGFIHSAAYLANHLHKTMGAMDLNTLVATMKTLSQEIIRKEQKALLVY